MPIGRVWYEEDHESFGRMMMSEQTAKVSRQAAHDVEALAKSFSPVSSGDGDHYVEHFEVVDNLPEIIGGNPRMSAMVVNDSDHGAAVEFGNTGQPRPQGGSAGPAYRPLGRAGAVVGEYQGGPPG